MSTNTCDRRSKLCICQICKCGHHQCPHKEKGKSDGETGKSEYRSRFEVHRDAEPSTSCKPREQMISTDAPLDGTSIHRKDYVKHPPCKLQRPKTPYNPLVGEMESLTSYQKDYICKPLDPAKPIVRRARYVVGEFVAEPSYKDDYKQWSVHPRRVRTASSYKPPTCQIEGDSDYRRTYVPHEVSRPPPTARPPPTSLQLLIGAEAPPFYGRTNYRDEFTGRHEEPTTGEIDVATDGLETEDVAELGKGDKLGGQQQQQQQRAEAAKRQVRVAKKPPRPPVVCSELVKSGPPRRYSRPPTRRGPGPFYGATSYRVEFPRREIPPPFRRPPEKYHAPSKPMDSVSQYRASYIHHCAPPARICRPAVVPPVNAPFPESTEQRDNFQGDTVEVCPAAQLLQRIPGCVFPADLEGPPRAWHRGIGRFRYSDRDDSGHEWYTFEECHLPGPENIVYDSSRYVRGDSVEAAAARSAAARALKYSPPRSTAIPVLA